MGVAGAAWAESEIDVVLATHILVFYRNGFMGSMGRTRANGGVGRDADAWRPMGAARAGPTSGWRSAHALGPSTAALTLAVPTDMQAIGNTKVYM